MRIPNLPWLEISIVFALLGSLWVSQIKQAARAARWGMIFTGLTFVTTLLAWLTFSLGQLEKSDDIWTPSQALTGQRLFELDALAAPLVPSIALLHFMTALATARTKMRNFSFSWSLASEAIRLAMFTCQPGWLLVGLIAISTIPPYIELLNRHKNPRLYVIHMAVFVGLLIIGWAGVQFSNGSPLGLAISSIPLMLAILTRCGTVPMHCWVTDWFENASFGNAILSVAPLTGVLAAVRLVLPIAPGWVLSGIAVSSLITAVYCAAMGTVQQDTRRLFAYLFLSLGSFAVISVVAGPGDSATDISDYRGLAQRQPLLALAFGVLLLGQAGAPFTTGFLAKLGVIEAAESTQSYVLATVAMATAAVAAFFYLRVAVTMFSPVGRSGAVPTSEDASQQDASQPVPTPSPDASSGDGIASLEVLTDAPPEADVIERGIQPVPPLTATAIGLCVAVTVVFGIIPGPLLDFAQQATLLIVGG